MEIPAPSNVLELSFAAWAFGLAIGTSIIRPSGKVQPGHFKVVYLTIGALAVATALLGNPKAWAVVAVSVLAFGIVRRVPNAPVDYALLGASAIPLIGSTPPDALAVALVLGGSTSAMLLGHWHLNQPRLDTGPLRKLVVYVWVGLVVGVADAVWLFSQAGGDGAVTVGAVTAGAFTVFSMVLAAMVTHLVKTRSIMSATGILYLQVLLAFVSGFTLSLAALAA